MAHFMDAWPKNLDKFDGINRHNPYPCCACKMTCYSVKQLRTHKCQPQRKKAKANA